MKYRAFITFFSFCLLLVFSSLAFSSNWTKVNFGGQSLQGIPISQVPTEQPLRPPLWHLKNLMKWIEVNNKWEDIKKVTGKEMNRKPTVRDLSIVLSILNKYKQASQKKDIIATLATEEKTKLVGGLSISDKQALLNAQFLSQGKTIDQFLSMFEEYTTKNHEIGSLDAVLQFLKSEGFKTSILTLGTNSALRLATIIDSFKDIDIAKYTISLNLFKDIIREILDALKTNNKIAYTNILSNNEPLRNLIGDIEVQDSVNVENAEKAGAPPPDAPPPPGASQGGAAPPPPTLPQALKIGFFNSRAEIEAFINSRLGKKYKDTYLKYITNQTDEAVAGNIQQDKAKIMQVIQGNPTLSDIAGAYQDIMMAYIINNASRDKNGFIGLISTNPKYIGNIKALSDKQKVEIAKNLYSAAYETIRTVILYEISQFIKKKAAVGEGEGKDTKPADIFYVEYLKKFNKLSAFGFFTLLYSPEFLIDVSSGEYSLKKPQKMTGIIRNPEALIFDKLHIKALYEKLYTKTEEKSQLKKDLLQELGRIIGQKYDGKGLDQIAKLFINSSGKVLLHTDEAKKIINHLNSFVINHIKTQKMKNYTGPIPPKLSEMSGQNIPEGLLYWMIKDEVKLDFIEKNFKSELLPKSRVGKQNENFDKKGITEVKGKDKLEFIMEKITELLTNSYASYLNNNNLQKTFWIFKVVSNNKPIIYTNNEINVDHGSKIHVPKVFGGLDNLKNLVQGKIQDLTSKPGSLGLKNAISIDLVVYDDYKKNNKEIMDLPFLHDSYPITLPLQSPSNEKYISSVALSGIQKNLINLHRDIIITVTKGLINQYKSIFNNDENKYENRDIVNNNFDTFESCLKFVKSFTPKRGGDLLQNAYSKKPDLQDYLRFKYGLPPKDNPFLVVFGGAIPDEIAYPVALLIYHFKRDKMPLSASLIK